LVSTSFIFVPGRAGVKRNERTDRLAGTADISYGREMDHTNVLHDLREEWKTHMETRSQVLWKALLRDGQVKLGGTRYEQYAGSQRRMLNQIRTGTVSRHTLLNVLERRSEHLWVCPVCKDDNLSTNH
jgi:hypothetical protein